MTIEAQRKGEKSDELRRIKDKSRKTQAFLSESKKVVSNTIKVGDTS
jgi:catabolite regulation protein CreA